eukprot:363931-Chlamydomonas_euryale.AAC.15
MPHSDGGPGCALHGSDGATCAALSLAAGTAASAAPPSCGDVAGPVRREPQSISPGGSAINRAPPVPKPASPFAPATAPKQLPSPEPTQAPPPASTPEPAPSSTPQPVPASIPEPAPASTPESAPASTPAPAPASTPAPAANLAPAPMPVTALGATAAFTALAVRVLGCVSSSAPCPVANCHPALCPTPDCHSGPCPAADCHSGATGGPAGSAAWASRSPPASLCGCCGSHGAGPGPGPGPPLPGSTPASWSPSSSSPSSAAPRADRLPQDLRAGEHEQAQLALERLQVALLDRPEVEAVDPRRRGGLRRRQRQHADAHFAQLRLERRHEHAAVALTPRLGARRDKRQLGEVRPKHAQQRCCDGAAAVPQQHREHALEVKLADLRRVDHLEHQVLAARDVDDGVERLLHHHLHALERLCRRVARALAAQERPRVAVLVAAEARFACGHERQQRLADAAAAAAAEPIAVGQRREVAAAVLAQAADVVLALALVTNDNSAVAEAVGVKVGLRQRRGAGGVTEIFQAARHDSALFRF